MPRYDVECEKCHVVEEVVASGTHHFTRCSCGGKRKWIPSARVAVFQPFMHEHLDHTPIRVTSWKHYKSLLKERNLHNELAD